MNDGRYAHFGIENALDDFISTLVEKPKELSLDFHIDGVEISSSSRVKLWTILC